MYYPEELVEEVRARNDIVDVISGYVTLKKKGSNYWGCCPFHNEKTPSFSVSSNKQMYYCFGCHASGNVYTFLMKYENDTFPEAVKILADRAGVKLPEVEETPEQTEGYEGFYHLIKINGSCERAELVYIVRDHDADKFAQKQQKLKEIADVMNQKYGEGTVDLQIKEQYRNMAEKIRPCYHLIENAKKACENVGIVPKIQPIRGGTDGARLSFMGLPCPNLGTGGYAFHGPYEHITVEGMDKSVEILMELVKIYGIIKKE